VEGAYAACGGAGGVRGLQRRRPPPPLRLLRLRRAQPNELRRLAARPRDPKISAKPRTKTPTGTPTGSPPAPPPKTPTRATARPRRRQGTSSRARSRQQTRPRARVLRSQARPLRRLAAGTL